MDQEFKGKVRTLTVNIPEELYIKFLYKLRSEGYSIRTALEQLILNYVLETIDGKVENK